MRWDFQCPFNCKFTQKSFSENIFKIGQDLTELWSWVCCSVFWSTLVYRQRRQCVHKNVVNRGMVLDGLYNQHRGVSACIVRVQHEHLPKCVAFSHVTRANATFQSWWFHELSTAITKIIPLHQSNLSMQLTLSNNKPSLTDESTYFSKWLICWSFFSNSADAAVAELFNASACISAVQWLVCD